MRWPIRIASPWGPSACTSHPPGWSGQRCSRTVSASYRSSAGPRADEGAARPVRPVRRGRRVAVVPAARRVRGSGERVRGTGPLGSLGSGGSGSGRGWGWRGGRGGVGCAQPGVDGDALHPEVAGDAGLRPSLRGAAARVLALRGAQPRQLGLGATKGRAQQPCGLGIRGQVRDHFHRTTSADYGADSGRRVLRGRCRPGERQPAQPHPGRQCPRDRGPIPRADRHRVDALAVGAEHVPHRGVEDVITADKCRLVAVDDLVPHPAVTPAICCIALHTSLYRHTNEAASPISTTPPPRTPPAGGELRRPPDPARPVPSNGAEGRRHRRRVSTRRCGRLVPHPTVAPIIAAA